MAFLAIGPSGAGKSTGLEQIKHPSREFISVDEIRARLTGDPADQSQNTKAWAEAYRLIQSNLEAGRDVIVDATNARATDRRQLVAYCRQFTGEVVRLWFITSLRFCIAWNRRRKRQVPEHAIRRMHQFLVNEPPRLDEGFSRLIKVSPGDTIRL